jgi:hypothetical protein
MHVGLNSRSSYLGRFSQFVTFSLGFDFRVIPFMTRFIIPSLSVFRAVEVSRLS